MRVTVLYSPAPREVREWHIELPAGATVADALKATGMTTEFGDLHWSSIATGVWGRKAPPDQALREHDRVEVYRPLKVDPKVARRERFRKQGARAAGLFARKR